MTGRIKNVILALMAVTLMLAMSACARGEQENGGAGRSQTEALGLSETQMESLMKQTAKSDVTVAYGDYLRDEAFANAEVFGVDRDGEHGTAYVYLNEGEYVVLKDRAYKMSGSAGEVIIKFNYGKDDVTLTEVIWSADGEGHESWLKENYPAEYLEKARQYNAHDENGKNILDIQLEETVEKALGVPVEAENLLGIDTEKGTYEIVRTIDGDDGTFDIETIEEGKLSDL